MAYQGINSSYWAQANQDTATSMTPALNPAQPSFQPKGSEMQRYQTPRISGMKAMQEYIVGMNVSHIGDVVRLQRRTGKNEEDIEGLRATIQNDLGILERKIRDLELRQSTQSSPEPQYITQPKDYSPTQDMLDDFNLHDLAEAYSREACEREEEAVELRKQVAAIKGGEYGVPQMKLLEDSPSRGNPTDEQAPKPAAYACCETVYGSIQELVEHVEQSHANVLKVQADTTSQGTPTHVPAPRPGRTEVRSRAIPIKSPHHAAPNSDKSKADSAVDVPQPTKDAATESTAWMPFAVRQMKPITFEIPNHKETFSFEFLRNNLGGALWSSGFYFESGESILPSKAYWMLDSDKEPFIPKAPGQHGAKLSAFFNETPSEHAPDPDNYMGCPVFIIEPGTTEYRYLGNYSQTRYSDKVCYDCINDHIPDKTLRQWSVNLSQTGRPEWVTQAIMRHFWPIPSYIGPLPTDSALNTPATFATGENSSGGTERRVTKALNEHANELKDWQKEARLHASLLTSEAIYKSFKNPDSDIEPGLRLWWEYMECVRYDTGFYEMLVKMKQNPKLQNRNGKKNVKISTPNPPPAHKAKTNAPDVGGKTVPGGQVETLPNNNNLSTLPNDDDLSAIPTLDEEEVIHHPVHSPRPNPKKLQREQWSSVDKSQAESDSQKRTTFTKPKFDNGPTKKASVLKTKDHTRIVKPWEKKSGDDGAASGWVGKGDLKAAKELNESFQDGRLKAGAGGGSRRKGGPPHLRGK